ncbi:MAG: CoA ester lyase [Rhodoferax sp.]
MSKPDFVRRSQLITPARSEKMIAKALAVNCDSLIIDLEDGIAPNFKIEAREVLRHALANVTPDPRRELCVRINGLESPWCLEDLFALQGLPINSVVVPKVHTPEDMYVFDQLLRQLELRGGGMGLTLQPLIESACGLENAYAIARTSARCRTLIFGVGDFMADTGMSFSPSLLLSVRARIVTAAAAAGLQAIDHVHPGVADIDGLLLAARESKALGFTGKWAIHPNQVEVIHTAFSPSEAEIDKARRTLAAYSEALQAGVGAMTLDGELVDEAVLKMARRHLASADRIICNTPHLNQKETS